MSGKTAGEIFKWLATVSRSGVIKAIKLLKETGKLLKETGKLPSKSENPNRHQEYEGQDQATSKEECQTTRIGGQYANANAKFAERGPEASSVQNS